MSELIKPVVLQRPLLTPSPEKVGELQADLISIVERYLPLDYNTVRFVKPGAVFVPIVGGNTIEHAVHTANDRTELPNLSGEVIAARIMDAIRQLPNHDRVITAKNFANVAIGSRPDRRTFSTLVEHPDIMRERFIGTTAVRLLGGIPVSRNQMESHHPATWAFFRTEMPDGMDTLMAEAANDHVPPGCEMIFGPIETLDLGVAETPYMYLSAR